MPSITFYNKETGEITGNLYCDEDAFNDNVEGKDWVYGWFNSENHIIQHGRAVAKERIEDELPEPVRTRKKRKNQYLMEFPVEKQLEALVEAADNRPEKLLAMIERMKEIKNEVKTLA